MAKIIRSCLGKKLDYGAAFNLMLNLLTNLKITLRRCCSFVVIKGTEFENEGYGGKGFKSLNINKCDVKRL